jgi:hypothetical protein
MKKFSALLFFFITLLFSLASMAQSSDYFVGDWEVQIKDTPMGTISVVLTLERVDGKLTGKFVDKASGVETKMNQITEQTAGLTLSFTAEGYGDLYLTLQRADDESVTGSLMDSFSVEGKRMAQKSDYFVGDWEVTIKDTPMGTISVVLTLERGEDGKLVGEFVDAANSTSTPMTQITEAEGSITLYFFAEGMDLYLNLKPEGDENVTGSLMDSFAIEGKRVKK